MWVKVRVEGLGGATSWQDLKDFARKAGQPTFTNVYRDQGIGIVEFAHPDDVRSPNSLPLPVCARIPLALADY